jgi:hypothetical protein
LFAVGGSVARWSPLLLILSKTRQMGRVRAAAAPRGLPPAELARAAVVAAT